MVRHLQAQSLRPSWHAMVYRKRKNFQQVQISTFSPRVVKNKFSSMVNFDQRAWLQLEHTCTCCIRSYFFDFL